MKKALLSLAVAALAISGCRKEPEPEPEPIDIYAEFKADAIPRWENGSTTELSVLSTYVFITDAGESLFESAKYKTGRIRDDGSDYEIIEFSGSPKVGVPAEPSIRKPSGSVNLYRLEIMKMENDKLWIVFQETATSTEWRVVQ